ncbi:efflux RND transporter periplasmic adaptor subunit [Paenibacillus contaminans]|nr:efflux RND transporter periplasmic adaptor subunit [Paenibacillus contaminans]
MTKQRLAGLFFGLFFLVLGGLTLFSNTLQTALLPKAVTEKPVKKALEHRITGSGVLVPRLKKDLPGYDGWQVAEVHASKNDQVKKGQPLITFKSPEAELLLLDEEARMKKQSLNRELLQEQFIAAQQSGSEEAIRKAKRDLELDKLDADIAKRKLESMRSDMESKRVLAAPFDGKVVDMKAESGMKASQGQTLVSLIAGSEGYEFSFQAEARSAALLQTGEKAAIDVKGKTAMRLEGIISEIKETSAEGSGSGGGNSLGGPDTSGGNGSDGTRQRKTIVVKVTDEAVQGGEQASVKIAKQALQQGLVIRKELLKSDGSGSYVFVVRAKKSALGNAYYAQKAYVQTGEEAEDEIVVLNGLSPEDEIITETSEPLQDGNRVRLQG